MTLNENFPVAAVKKRAIEEKIQRLKIDLRQVEETFVKGGGKGGQKINKTANAVELHYPPLGLVVKVQRERRRSLNRFLALRELVDQIEMKVSPETSERMKEWERRRKQKDRRRRRADLP
jgi:protein subunit release factor B